VTQELVIEAGRTERYYWQDLWHYRELFQVPAWRDVSVRYKQTVIGIAWALIRPFLMMVVFTIIFGRLAKLPSDGSAPYARMVFAGMLPWSFFERLERCVQQPAQQRAPGQLAKIGCADRGGHKCALAACM
jgi:lipopolysaccharide transport system permease protein